MTELPKVSITEGLEVDNDKIVGIGGSGDKPPHC